MMNGMYRNPNASIQTWHSRGGLQGNANLTYVIDPNTGEQTPIVYGTDQYGNPLSLHQLYGYNVVMTVGARWCPPCNEAAKTSQAMWSDGAAGKDARKLRTGGICCGLGGRRLCAGRRAPRAGPGDRALGTRRVHDLGRDHGDAVGVEHRELVAVRGGREGDVEGEDLRSRPAHHRLRRRDAPVELDARAQRP